MITVAGREADIVGISIGTSETTRRRLAWLREGAQERFDRLELATVVFEVEITDQQKAVAQRIASLHQTIPGELPPPRTPSLPDTFILKDLSNQKKSLRKRGTSPAG